MEAAARIEALEAALNDIIIRAEDYDEAATIARAALAPPRCCRSLP
jgi:protein-arginine kinase activator protein McsA